MKSKIYLFAILLFACEKSDRIEIDGLRIPYIVGRFPPTEEVCETEEMQRGGGVVDYIGPLSDTIRISNFELYINSYKYDVKKPHEWRWSRGALECKIIASANQFIATESRLSGNLMFVQAIPVFIYNPTNDTVQFEHQDGKVKMIQEAKNEIGYWKPIEYWDDSWDGMSYGASGLLPNQIALVHVLRYEGDFVTDVRLKFKVGREVIYSNSYKALIYKSQFEIPAHVMDYYLKRKEYDKEFLHKIFLKAGV